MQCAIIAPDSYNTIKLKVLLLFLLVTVASTSIHISIAEFITSQPNNARKKKSSLEVVCLLLSQHKAIKTVF